MKNLKRNFAIVFLFFSLSFFGFEKKDSLYTIEIDGALLVPKSENVTPYKVILFCDDRIIDSIDVSDNEPFLLKLKKNKRYAVRIVKQGYLSVLVTINTNLPTSNRNLHIFHFDTEMVPVLYHAHTNNESDFRIGNITFNTKDGVFTYK